MCHGRSRGDRKLYLVSLGCPKNRLDSEVMLGLAERSGYLATQNPEEAEVIVVNTCGFIQAAKQESIETIIELAANKLTGQCKKLVVTGCLSQRYPEELAAELPEVDHFLGTSDVLLLERVLTRNTARLQVGSPGRWLMAARTPRRRTTPQGTAFVRLSEGCNRRCSFCAIPLVRGRQSSRPARDILREVKALSSEGVREINLVAQDSSNYGRDLTPSATLGTLVAQLAEVPGIHWVRIHYLYPDSIEERLLALWAEHPKVIPYVDLPLQHIADPVLRHMRRGYSGRAVRRLLEQLRARVPNLTLRTAFIVGHPGESERDFQELLQFVETFEFDRVGVFAFSEEAETQAAHLEPKVPPKLAEQRARQLMALGRRLLVRKNRALIGSELEVLVEGRSEESELVMVGRHAGQAPEIDGSVVLSGDEFQPAELRQVRIVRAVECDLLGEASDQQTRQRGSRS